MGLHFLPCRLPHEVDHALLLAKAQAVTGQSVEHILAKRQGPVDALFIPEDRKGIGVQQAEGLAFGHGFQDVFPAVVNEIQA